MAHKVVERRLLEMVTAQNNKFYEVTIFLNEEEKEYIVAGRYGKRTGTWRDKEAWKKQGGTNYEFGRCENINRARAIAIAQIRKKLSKGYREIDVPKIKEEKKKEQKKKVPGELEDHSLGRFGDLEL